MKLYTRGQVIAYSAVAAVGVLATAAILGFVSFPRNGVEVGTRTVGAEAGSAELSLPTYPVQYADAILGAGSDLTGDEANSIGIYEALNEAVVNVTSISLRYNWFFDPVPQEGTGSGSIIDESGYVLTNWHVIQGASDLRITLADGTEHEGHVVGYDRENDLAVLRFEPPTEPLSVIPFGSSAELRIGQKVLAIGNPFALERTLTTGIVSGLGRSVRVASDVIINSMIQTDASINPGNSGGPLLNSRGEMIGINTVIQSSSGESIGIGFAVPVDTARRVVRDLVAYGRVRRGWIEIDYAIQLFPALSRLNDPAVPDGVLVSEVRPGTNAFAAGIRGGDRERYVRYQMRYIYLGGDVIVEVDGMSVSSRADFYSALEDNKPGDTVTVKVVRGRQKRSFSVTLSERPEGLPW